MENRAVYLTELQKMSFGTCPMPKAGEGEVVVKIEAVGICGSDLHYYSHGKIGDFVVQFPFILGHECAGIVTEVGPGVQTLHVGDRVALEPGIPCGHCEFCLSGKYNLCPDVRFFATPPYDGCLMEYVAHPAQFAFPLPDSVSLEEGALVEPLAVGFNAVQTARVALGDTVVVFGAGCIGLTALLCAKACGATKILVVDMVEKRLELAREMGAETICAKEKDVISAVAEYTGGKGAEVVLDCAGANVTLRQSIEVAKAGGRVVWVGMASDTVDGLRIGPINTKELEIRSIFRYRNLYPSIISALATGKIDVGRLVTNRYSFDETPKAFAETYQNPQDIVKSVITFS